MATDNDFIAVGPPESDSPVPQTGFVTSATEFDFGVNVQGNSVGLYAESVNAETGRKPPTQPNGGIGVCGVGGGFGVLGAIHGSSGLAGVVGEHRRGGTAIVGASRDKPDGTGGIGVAGISHISTNPGELASPPEPARGHGTGVLGSSGSGPGVRGTSSTGPGVVGESESDRGGVFVSSGLTPQIGLVPRHMPVPGTVPARPVIHNRDVLASLPRGGSGGDLLVTVSDEHECTLWFCTRSEDPATMQPAAWSQVLLAAPAAALDVTEISWPQTVVQFDVGDSGPGPDRDPHAVVGPPDGVAYTLFEPHMNATFGAFTAQTYADLQQLLAGDHITAGDRPTADDLARTDVIAFELNGGAPAAGGGWESCDFSFSDGTTTVAVPWNGAAGAPRDAHVIANGSIRGADYATYFGAEPGSISDQVISFLLFALPELDTADPAFTVTVTGRPPGAGEEVTPDIDAIGVVAR